MAMLRIRAAHEAHLLRPCSSMPTILAPRNHSSSHYPQREHQLSSMPTASRMPLSAHPLYHLRLCRLWEGCPSKASSSTQIRCPILEGARRYRRLHPCQPHQSLGRPICAPPTISIRYGHLPHPRKTYIFHTEKVHPRSSDQVCTAGTRLYPSYPDPIHTTRNTTTQRENRALGLLPSVSAMAKVRASAPSTQCTRSRGLSLTTSLISLPAHSTAKNVL